MNERVYILLPVHNRREITQKFMNCLKIQTYQDFHLVLIDDGSTDGTEAMAQESIQPEKLTVIKGKGNWWWAGSLQQGINWLKREIPKPSDIILIINDDVTFKKDFIENGVNEMRKTPKTLLLARSFDESTGEIIETGVHADLKQMAFRLANSPDEINCLSTRGLFLFYSDLKNIGGFHPFLLPHYWSDLEFTMRAYKKDYFLATSPNVVLTMDVTKTGWHDINRMHFSSFQESLTAYFSKKSVPNPIYRSVFILLACPMRYKLVNLMRTWGGALRFILKRMAKSFRICKAYFDLKKELKGDLSDIKIIIGSGGLNQDNWICTDYRILDVTDHRSFAKLFWPDTVSAFFAEHVWEHLTVSEASLAVRNCLKYLKPGGYLRVAVPDGNHPDSNYIDQVRPGGNGPGAEDHKILYNYKMLSELLENEGFKVKLLEWFDENGDFHFEEWSPEDGMVRRSMRFDQRNQNKSLTYTSLIIDGYKPL